MIKKITFSLLWLFLLATLMVFSGCKTTGKLPGNKEEDVTIYDKYSDYVKDNKYVNTDLGLIIPFDNEWLIKARYEDFDDFQKKYAKYFSSEKGEVLFIGYNESKQLGIRATCEKVNLSNEEYLMKIKSIHNEMKMPYLIKEMLDGQPSVLTNIEVLRYIIIFVLNKDNKFSMDSIIFRDNEYNYKIDIWASKPKYDKSIKYINLLFHDVDLIVVQPPDKDATTDTGAE